MSRAAGLAADPSRVEHGIPPEALFLVWGPPGHGPRSQAFARELGIRIHHVTSSRRRGALVAPFKYASMLVKTLRLLWTRRPPVVFVQSPPTFAAAAVCLYAAATGARFVVDAHSAAMLSPYWTRPRWLSRLVARRAAATIVTNEHFARRIRRWGAVALVIPDIPTAFPVGAPFPVTGAFTVMVVSSFAPDEPVAAIVAAAGELVDVDFYVTGDPERARGRLPRTLPPNVHLTGFLPDPDYYALMASCQAVLCLTTRDHTMQRGACEALWVGTPIVTSDWPLLREYFTHGTVHVGASAREIADGIREVARGHGEYRGGIRRLRAERRAGWHARIATIASLVDPRDPTDGASARSTDGRRRKRA